jgi:hypothetical protein
VKELREQPLGYQRRAAAFPPARISSPEGNPPALSANWRGLTVLAIIEHVSCEDDACSLIPAFSRRLAIPHISRLPELNPKGILSMSPRLRGTSYPGCERWKDSPTLKSELNSKGILSLSPGLQGTSYPGCYRTQVSPTLKGLRHQTGTTAARQRPAPCCNPFRVEHDSGIQPRVARASQPWAGGYNPFGIEHPA